MGFVEATNSRSQTHLRIEGRTSRSEVWWFCLFATLCSIVATFIGLVAFGTDLDENGTISLGITVAILVPVITAAVRRVHHTDRTGYYILAPLFISIVGMMMAGLPVDRGAMAFAALGLVVFGLLVQIYWLILKSNLNENRFGPNRLWVSVWIRFLSKRW